MDSENGFKRIVCDKNLHVKFSLQGKHILEIYTNILETIKELFKEKKIMFCFNRHVFKERK